MFERNGLNSRLVCFLFTDTEQVLAIGFLLVILSSALFNNYLPLLVVATYVVAPLPNFICGRCANTNDFTAESDGSAVIDFGRFVTGFLVVMGICKCCSCQSLYPGTDLNRFEGGLRADSS